MNVESIMTTRVVGVRMDDTLRTVKHLFEHHPFHHLVVFEHGKAVGVLSDRDLLRNISPFIGKLAERSMDEATLNKRVHQIMTRRIIAVRRSTPITDAARMLIDHRISCLPVLDDDGRCEGIVTWFDLMKWMINRECGAGGSARAA